MKTYRVTVEYDGSRFSGWQIQNHLRTVQGEIQKAIYKMTHEHVVIMGSGRTDAGVHALGQVFHMRIKKEMKSDVLFTGLNALLPVDIAILQIEEANPEFDARKCAKLKTYQYRFYSSPVKRAFLEPYALKLRPQFNIEWMIEASKQFVGKHDYKAYQAKGSTATSTIRTIYNVEWQKVDECWYVDITGNGFLYHMVRNMVGVLLSIGYGKQTEQFISASFQHLSRQLLPPTAPAHGLFLKNVSYSEEVIDTRGEVV